MKQKTLHLLSQKTDRRPVFLTIPLWKVALITLSSVTIFISSPGTARWVSANGEATIIAQDIESARQRASREAVKHALLQAGASVSSLQQLSNGVVTQDSFEVRTDGEIRQIITKKEKIEGDKLSVTLQVDILSDANRCSSAKYAKSLSLARFTIAHREQAIEGELYQLGKEFSRKLYQELSKMPQQFDTRQWIDAVLPFNLNQISIQSDTDRQQLLKLASDHDSQFILLGEIDDLSFRKSDSQLDSFWFSTKIRHFGIRMALFDGITGEQLLSKHYETSDKWENSDDPTAGLQSATFWMTDYGNAMTRVMDDMIIDLNATLQCQQPLARIVAIDEQTVQINLGKNNGLKTGDRFELLHNAGFIDQFGHQRNKTANAHFNMSVEQTYPRSAILISNEEETLSNIQLNDLARLRR